MSRSANRRDTCQWTPSIWFRRPVATLGTRTSTATGRIREGRTARPQLRAVTLPNPARSRRRPMQLLASRDSAMQNERVTHLLPLARGCASPSWRRCRIQRSRVEVGSPPCLAFRRCPQGGAGSCRAERFGIQPACGGSKPTFPKSAKPVDAILGVHRLAPARSVTPSGGVCLAPRRGSVVASATVQVEASGWARLSRPSSLEELVENRRRRDALGIRRSVDKESFVARLVQHEHFVSVAEVVGERRARHPVDAGRVVFCGLLDVDPERLPHRGEVGGRRRSGASSSVG